MNIVARLLLKRSCGVELKTSLYNVGDVIEERGTKKQGELHGKRNLYHYMIIEVYDPPLGEECDIYKILCLEDSYILNCDEFINTVNFKYKKIA
jgi:hypothetical protein